jgi:hypothetical protein
MAKIETGRVFGPARIATYIALVACAVVGASTLLTAGPAAAAARAGTGYAGSGPRALVTFRGAPPITVRLVSTASGDGSVRLQLVENPVPLWVSATGCGRSTGQLPIAANDHAIHVVLRDVPTGCPVTIRLVGTPTPVIGRAWS